ncbi:hypothetical protein [Acinetobacter bereziniae]|uniref:hypothetical protein n=1 Tax=Acinetobacter bereziniae TaxID=106648 RepID=UPI00125005AB|nr:hypothetical protein [Acinetobacter bereziniae]
MADNKRFYIEQFFDVNQKSIIEKAEIGDQIEVIAEIEWAYVASHSILFGSVGDSLLLVNEFSNGKSFKILAFKDLDEGKQVRLKRVELTLKA